MRSIALRESTAPVGLFGLVMYTKRVFGVTAFSNASQSTSHESSTRASSKRSTVAPRLRGTPHSCR